MSDAQPIPVRMWNGYPYLSLAGVGAIIMAAIVWGSTSQRLADVEKRVTAVEGSAATVASKEDVHRVERRLERIEALLIGRSQPGDTP